MADSLRVILADDEPYNRKRLARLLREAGCEVLAELGDGPSVLDWMARGQPIDAVFMDIEMPGATGLETALDLPKGLGVVFITAFAEHAVKAFETAALDYLVKPVTAERLEVSLARVREHVGRTRPDTRLPAPTRFPVRAGQGLLLVDLARTTHFHVEDEVVWAHVGGEALRTPWASLNEVEAALPGAGLIRGHRHLLLRPEAIMGLRPGPYGRLWVRFTGGSEVEVSRGAAPVLKERLGLTIPRQPCSGAD